MSTDTAPTIDAGTLATAKRGVIVAYLQSIDMGDGRTAYTGQSKLKLDELRTLALNVQYDQYQRSGNATPELPPAADDAAPVENVDQDDAPLAPAEDAPAAVKRKRGKRTPKPAPVAEEQDDAPADPAPEDIPEPAPAPAPLVAVDGDPFPGAGDELTALLVINLTPSKKGTPEQVAAAQRLKYWTENVDGAPDIIRATLRTIHGRATDADRRLLAGPPAAGERKRGGKRSESTAHISEFADTGDELQTHKCSGECGRVRPIKTFPTVSNAKAMAARENGRPKRLDECRTCRNARWERDREANADGAAVAS